MNDPRESMEGAPLAPLLGTPKVAYSNVPKRLRVPRFSVQPLVHSDQRINCCNQACLLKNSLLQKSQK